MNRDDAIKMAREAGADVTAYINYYFDEEMVLFSQDNLARFIDLVVAAEREACAKLCAELDAKMETELGTEGFSDCINFAEAIRARGEK